MHSHLTIFSSINVVRGLGGIFLAGWFIYFSMLENIPFFRSQRLEPGDLMAFLIVGYVVGALALVRLFHGIVSLWMIDRSRWLSRSKEKLPRLKMLFHAARRLGIWLSIVDLADLTLFPITTACGIYGLLVCRNSGLLDLLEGKSFDSLTERN